MFRSARIKLTVAYTMAIALVMVAFSVALYIVLSSAMASNLEVPESASVQVEHAILQAQLARARLALFGINLGGAILAAAASYVIAGRTLAPIESDLSQQRRFTAHASHELRTPLTVIKGEIDVTRARRRSAEEYLETLNRIDEEVLHLETIVGDLLTLARMQQEQITKQRERGKVAQVIEEVTEPFAGDWQQREIRLLTVVPPDLEATLDWRLVRHLLINLIDNASQHTGCGGKIEIRASQQGKYLDVCVFNSGSAISANDLPHIFEPFYRGKGSNPETGTGLGLALCDSIARIHQGSIAAHNVDSGVIFDVRLPRE